MVLVALAMRPGLTQPRPGRTFPVMARQPDQANRISDLLGRAVGLHAAIRDGLTTNPVEGGTDETSGPTLPPPPALTRRSPRNRRKT